MAKAKDKKPKRRLGEKAGFERDLDALRSNLDRGVRPQTGIGFLGLLIVVIIAVSAVMWTSRSSGQFAAISIVNGGINAPSLEERSQWQITALDHALTGYLEASPALRILPNTAKGDPLLDQVRQHRTLGGQWLLSASYAPSLSDSADHVSLRLELRHIHDESRHFATDINGSALALDDLAARACMQVLLWLDRRPLNDTEQIMAEAEWPKSPEGARFFAEGLRALNAHLARKAADDFGTARLHAGDHPMVLNNLARAWADLGYQKTAQDLAQLALEKSAPLSRQRQLEIEGAYATMKDDWDRAENVYLALKEFHPEDVNYWLDLIDVQTRAGKHENAKASLAAMRALPFPARDDPRVDLAESNLWYYSGNYEKGVTAAQKAITKARELGNAAILADALMAFAASDGPDTPGKLQEALSLYRALDNPGQQAQALQELGTTERYSGRLDSALANFEQALSVARAIGDAPHEAAALNAMSIAMDLQGRLEEGYALKQQVAAYYAERHVTTRHAIMLENMGISLFKMGRLAEARAQFDAAFPLFVEVNDEIGIAYRPYHLMRIAMRRGDLEEAAAFAVKAIENSKEHPEGHLEINALYDVGKIAFYRGDLEGAFEALSKTAAAYAKNNMPFDAAEAKVMLARIAAFNGDDQAAEKMLNEAMTTFATSGAGYYALATQIEIVDLALKTKDPQSRAACTQLGAMLQEQAFMEYALRGQVKQALCQALVMGKSKRIADEILEGVEIEATRLGLFEPLLEAKFAKATLSRWQNDERAAAVQFAEAEKLAQDHSWQFARP